MAIPSEEPVPDGSVPDPGPEVTASVADPGDPPVPPSPFTTARAWLRRPTVRKSVRWTASLIIIVFVVEYLLLPQIARARQNLPLLGRVNIILLVLGVLAEAAALGAYAQLTHSVLQPDPPKRNVLLRINLSCFALSHVMPAGAAPGGALGYRLLGDAGVPGSVAALGLAVQAVGSAVVLNLIFWIALVFSIPLNGFNPAYGFAALAGVLLLAAFAGTLLLLSRGDRHADGWLRHG